jgi:hypothetical protein
MSDYDEIPDWYEEEEGPPTKKTKSQPSKIKNSAFFEKSAPQSPKRKISKKSVKKPSTQPGATKPEKHVPSKATNITLTEIHKILKGVFGHDTFRGQVQEDAIKGVVVAKTTA